MDKDFGIRARQDELNQIHNFVTSHVKTSTSGILYVTGPPGTGKTMSVAQILNRIDSNMGKLHLNCFKALNSKSILNKICESIGRENLMKTNEPEIIAQLQRTFSGRTCKPYLLVLDEMDQLPKSKHLDLFRAIFSWTRLRFSKLIIIGIANTVNLTARCQAIATCFGEDYKVERITFKPYTSAEIKSILEWYLENDENFEEDSIEPKALEIIAKRFARDNGDIRGALNALRSSVQDQQLKQRQSRGEDIKEQQFPTPPSTPPPSPCKEKTNIVAVANSVRKRQRESHYFEDNIPTFDKVILVTLYKLCSQSSNSSVDKKNFFGKAANVMCKYGVPASSVIIQSVLEQLEAQGLLTFKTTCRKMSTTKIVLKASESEISRLVCNKDSIMEYISNVI